MIFLRFKIETLEYYFAKDLINKGLKSVVQIPLSPPVEIQNEAKLTKFKDLVGFFHLWHTKLYIKSQNLGVF